MVEDLRPCGTRRHQRGLAVWVFLICAVLAGLPYAVVEGTKRRRWANMTVAAGLLKVLGNAQSRFREKNQPTHHYGTLEELETAGLIDTVLASGTRQGYVFRVHNSTTTPEFLWCGTASPIDEGPPEYRHFGLNHEGVIFLKKTPITVKDDCSTDPDASVISQ